MCRRSSENGSDAEPGTATGREALKEFGERKRCEIRRGSGPGGAERAQKIRKIRTAESRRERIIRYEMRQRKLKGLEERLSVYSGGISVRPDLLKGRWMELFDRNQPICLELGCGKGQFILSLAEAYPHRNYIAVEGNESVMLRALQKAARHFCSLSHPKSDESGNERPFEERVERGVFSVGNISEKNISCGRDASAGSGTVTAENHSPGDGGCVYRAAPNLVFVNMYVRALSDYFAEDELSGIYLNFSDPWPKARHAKRRLTHAGYLSEYGRVLQPGGFLEFKTDNEGLFRFSVEEFRRSALRQEEYSEDLHSSDFESKKFMTEYEEKFSSQGHPIYYCKVRYETPL